MEFHGFLLRFYVRLILYVYTAITTTLLTTACVLVGLARKWSRCYPYISIRITCVWISTSSLRVAGQDSPSEIPTDQILSSQYLGQG